MYIMFMLPCLLLKKIEIQKKVCKSHIEKYIYFMDTCIGLIDACIPTDVYFKFL